MDGEAAKAQVGGRRSTSASELGQAREPEPKLLKQDKVGGKLVIPNNDIYFLDKEKL
jgi:hypothetical protein